MGRRRGRTRRELLAVAGGGSTEGQNSPALRVGYLPLPWPPGWPEIAAAPACAGSGDGPGCGSTGGSWWWPFPELSVDDPSGAGGAGSAVVPCVFGAFGLCAPEALGWAGSWVGAVCGAGSGVLAAGAESAGADSVATGGGVDSFGREGTVECDGASCRDVTLTNWLETGDDETGAWARLARPAATPAREFPPPPGSAAACCPGP